MTTTTLGATLAAALTAAALLTGCGSDGTTAPAAAPATPTTSAAPEKPADLVLVPGAAGPVQVGMSKAEAIATGLLAAGVDDGVEGCPTPPLVWTEPFAGTLDVYVLADGEVASIGVREVGPETADGLGVGSTLTEVLAANPGAEPVKAGYDQTAVLVEDPTTDGWIGFLFDSTLAEVEQSDPVTFVELTQGEKPSVIRDGC